MKLALILLATTAPVAEAQDSYSSCWSADVETCADTQFARCEDACALIKSKEGCATDSKCEWVSSSFLGMTSESCSIADATVSCSANTRDDCTQIEGCAWLTGRCGLDPECAVKSCTSYPTAEECAAPRCKWDTDLDWCMSDSFAEEDPCAAEEMNTESVCTANAECEWKNDCEDLDPCTFATEAACVAETGCFWVKQQGTMEVSSMMTGAQTVPVEPSCLPCHTDVTKMFSSYQFVKDNENSGCSVSAEVSLLGMTISIQGSIDLLGAVPATDGSCAGGEAENMLAADLGGMGEMTSDCSYEVGKAPMGHNFSAGSKRSYTAVVLVCLAAVFW